MVGGKPQVYLEDDVSDYRCTARGAAVKLLRALGRTRVTFGPATLADRVYRPSLAMDAVLILVGAAFISICAQIVVPIWPIPSTAQIVGILIVAFSLGMIRGTLSLIIYVSMGALGLPVFNSGGAGVEHLMGTTGGYLFGFILAAAIAGYFAWRRWDRTFGRALLAGSIATLAAFAVGLPWLAAVAGYSFQETMEFGFLAIVPGSVVKVLFVAVVMSTAWHGIRSIERKRNATAQITQTLRRFAAES